MYRGTSLLSVYLAIISLGSRAAFFISRSLCFSSRHNNVRRFVPVTLAEWCQLHKDSCRAQKCRGGCWREIARFGGDKSRKGERILSERVKRSTRVRRRGTKQGAKGRSEEKSSEIIRQRELYKEGGPMNEETGRKSTNRKLVPPWHFLKNYRERGKEVKKVKVCANTMSPLSLSPCQPPPFTPSFYNRCQSLFPFLHFVRSAFAQFSASSFSRRSLFRAIFDTKFLLREQD